MTKSNRRYSSKLKFQVVLGVLQGKKTPVQIAKAYGVHPNTGGLWKQAFLENGPLVFETASATNESDRRIADLEKLLGKKEVGMTPLKNFLG